MDLDEEMQMSKSVKTLPPRHGGYRAAKAGSRANAKTGTYLKLPKPPKGEGGGSKKDQTQ